MVIFSKKKGFLLCFLVFHIFLAGGTWLRKGGKEKENISKKYSKQYQLQNTVWGYEKPSKGYKKQKDKAAVCKSKKFSEKVKKLYKCKEQSTTVSSSKQQKTSDPLARCRDDNIYCATWASLSECSSNPSWMLLHCPIACNQCNFNCGDYNSQCNKWAGEGECGSNRQYMKIYCRKSCSLCVTCTDSDRRCGRWGRK